MRGNETKNKLRELASAADLIVKSFDFPCQTYKNPGGGAVCQNYSFHLVMVSEDRTRCGAESEDESNHPDKISFAMPHQGILPRHLPEFLLYRCQQMVGDGKYIIRKLPESVSQRTHSRDPSTCTHSGFAGTRAALRMTALNFFDQTVPLRKPTTEARRHGETTGWKLTRR